MDGGYQPEHGGFEPGRVRGRPSRSKWKQLPSGFAQSKRHGKLICLQHLLTKKQEMLLISVPHTFATLKTEGQSIKV
jgi:hypothetical protein